MPNSAMPACAEKPVDLRMPTTDSPIPARRLSCHRIKRGSHVHPTVFYNHLAHIPRWHGPCK